MKYSRQLLVYALSLLLLGGCVSLSKPPEFPATAEGDYAQAKYLIEKEKYSDAATLLENFGSSHPYSQLLAKAQILRMYAAYKKEEYVLVQTLADHFIERHPRHPEIDYVKYLLAMSHYKQIAPADRDPSETQAAIDAFRRLIKDHPQSSYAREASGRLQKLNNRLAFHELKVGLFYFNRGRYVAAANRFQTIVERYQTTPSIEEALYYLAASYARMGLKEDARQVAILLQHNYPRGTWSAKASEYR